MKRNNFLDILKGTLMTLVVIGHLQIFKYDAKLIVLIYSFHMPLFLIIGGFLNHTTKDTNYFTIIKKRFFSCIIPYIIFNLISLYVFTDNNTRWDSIKTFFYGIGEPNTSKNLPTWFLTFYFCSMCIYDSIKLFVLKLKIKKNQKFLLMTSLIIIITTIGYMTFPFFRKVIWPPFNIQQAMYCIGFIYIGDLCKAFINSFDLSKIYNKNKILNTILLIILLTITFVIWYKLSLQNGRIDLNARDYKNKILFFINALLGSILFTFANLLILQIPYINKLFSYIGKNSLYVLGYHLLAFATIFWTLDWLMKDIYVIIWSNKLIHIIYYVTLEILISLIYASLHKKIFCKQS